MSIIFYEMCPKRLYVVSIFLKKNIKMLNSVRQKNKNRKITSRTLKASSKSRKHKGHTHSANFHWLGIRFLLLLLSQSFSPFSSNPDYSHSTPRPPIFLIASDLNTSLHHTISSSKP